MSPERLNTRLIQINLDYLETKGMDLNQYLSLMKLYVHQEENELLPIKVCDEDFDWLIQEGLIEEQGINLILTDKGREIFERKGDKFEEFYKLFPHKVPDGFGNFRVLSTKDPDSILGNKARKKWARVTKGNLDLQDAIIAALRYEIEYRKKSNSLTYMQNIDTWLNNGTWEKYMDEAVKQNQEKREDKLL
jgi:hypothetical protein